ncbi:hypothetical protein SLS55_002028 [Diplodia seriata]|uniref:Uncharacterized protein n=1 Tax=Diplodia seriata TaxID=420778 RepID=A0ABR3CQZ9_9PEZI
MTTIADADYSMQAAIFNGLTHSAEEIMQQPQFSCLSGNCTWDPFESLAVCSTCNDVSEDIKTIRSEADVSRLIVLPAFETSVPIAMGNIVTFHLSNGHLIDNYEFQRSSSPYMTTYGTGNKNETISLQEVDTLLWGMSFLRITNTEAREWPNVDLEATECGLYYCVKQYNATVSNGTFHETEEEVSTASRAVDSWLPLSDDDTEKLTSLEWLDSLNFNTAFSSVERSDLVLGNQFNLSQSAIDSISSFFQTYFIRTEIHPGYNSSLKLNGYSQTEAHYAPSSIQAFRTVPSLDTTFQILARSMSNALSADSDNSTVQLGSNRVMQVIYRIMWQWITPHAVVMTTGTAFLLMTIHESRKHTIPVWRSSSLAVLSRGKATKDILHGLGTREDLEKQAAQACVQLLDRRPRQNGMTY